MFLLYLYLLDALKSSPKKEIRRLPMRRGTWPPLFNYSLPLGWLAHIKLAPPSLLGQHLLNIKIFFLTPQSEFCFMGFIVTKTDNICCNSHCMLEKANFFLSNFLQQLHHYNRKYNHKACSSISLRATLFCRLDYLHSLAHFKKADTMLCFAGRKVFLQVFFINSFSYVHSIISKGRSENKNICKLCLYK